MLTFYDFGGENTDPFLVGGTIGDGTTATYDISLVGFGIQPGDIVFVASAYTNNGVSLPSITCTGDNSGAFVVARSVSEGGDTWDVSMRLMLQVMGGTPDTTLTIARTAEGGDRGGATAVHIWRNLDQTFALEGNAGASGTNTGRGDPPAVTPTTAGAIVIACGAGAQPPGGSAFTVPSGMINPYSAFGDGAISAIGVWIASHAWTSGAYDPAAWTGGTDSTNASWAAITIGIPPG